MRLPTGPPSIEQYGERHGHRPTRATITKLRHQANLSARPAKRSHSLADLSAQWRRRRPTSRRTQLAASEPARARPHPHSFTRADGTSAFGLSALATVLSAEHLSAAEDRLLHRGTSATAPSVAIEMVHALTGQPVKDNRLGPAQAQAIARIAVSGRPESVTRG